MLNYKKVFTNDQLQAEWEISYHNNQEKTPAPYKKVESIFCVKKFPPLLPQGKDND